MVLKDYYLIGCFEVGLCMCSANDILWYFFQESLVGLRLVFKFWENAKEVGVDCFGLQENETKTSHNLIDLAEERFSYLNKSLDFNSCVIEFPLNLNEEYSQCWLIFYMEACGAHMRTLNGNTFAFFPFDLFSGLQLNWLVWADIYLLKFK